MEKRTSGKRLRFMACLLGIALFAAGCAPVMTTEDPFVEEVIRRYPELAGKPWSKDTVKRVIDGDTYQTGSGERVRLIGVDTPELKGETREYGERARVFTRERLEGRTVYQFRDISDTDRYGRLLRYVFVAGDPVMFNETLLREGYAHVLTVPPDVQFADVFAKLAREARENRRGLWDEPAANACETPRIKGNINSRGEKIYHVPGGRHYDVTVAEEWFCTEEEAMEAGYRKAAR